MLDVPASGAGSADRSPSCDRTRGSPPFGIQMYPGPALPPSLKVTALPCATSNDFPSSSTRTIVSVEGWPALVSAAPPVLWARDGPPRAALESAQPLQAHDAIVVQASPARSGGKRIVTPAPE